MKMSELRKTMELDAIESKIDELKTAIANGHTALDPSFLVETLRQMDNLKDRCYDQLSDA